MFFSQLNSFHSLEIQFNFHDVPLKNDRNNVPKQLRDSQNLGLFHFNSSVWFLAVSFVDFPKFVP